MVIRFGDDYEREYEYDYDYEHEHEHEHEHEYEYEYEHEHECFEPASTGVTRSRRCRSSGRRG